MSLALITDAIALNGMSAAAKAHDIAEWRRDQEVVRAVGLVPRNRGPLIQKRSHRLSRKATKPKCKQLQGPRPS